MTGTREKAVKTAGSAETAEIAEIVETAGAGKDGEESKGEYLENLIRVLCIRYPINFRKKFVLVFAVLDLERKVNAIHPTFVKELSLSIRPTDV